MTDATTTMTTMSSAASMVSMPFLFPLIFLIFIFFTPFVFPVGLSMPVPQFGCKPERIENERLNCPLVPLVPSGSSWMCSCVVSPRDAHPGIRVVYPEDPGLGRLLSANDSFHHELKKQCFGALPIFEPRLDPDILDVHGNGSA